MTKNPRIYHSDETTILFDTFRKIEKGEQVLRSISETSEIARKLCIVGLEGMIETETSETLNRIAQTFAEKIGSDDTNVNSIHEAWIELSEKVTNLQRILLHFERKVL